MKDFETWRRIASSRSAAPPPADARRLYVPAIEPVGNLPYELAGLLPNREHSRDLMALIANLPDNRCGHDAVVGVFAVDPFLNCKRVADHLLAKGYRLVANLPPAASYGAEFLATLDKVASGKAQEQRNVSQLLDRGLSVVPAVAAIGDLPAALDWSPKRLWAVPSFDMWRDGAVDTGLLLRLCREVAGLTDTPVILAVGQTGTTAAAAAQAGARGILSDEYRCDES